MKIVLLALLERATLLEGAELTPPSPATVSPVARSGAHLAIFISSLSPLLVPRTHVLSMVLNLIIGSGGWSALCRARQRMKDASQASLWPGGKLEKEAEEGW